MHVGTLGLVLEPLATSVDVVLQELPAHVLVFCDPNCRAGAIPDRGGYLARLHRVLRRTDVVKVSGDDLAYLAPGRAPADGGAVAAGRRSARSCCSPTAPRPSGC